MLTFRDLFCVIVEVIVKVLLPPELYLRCGVLGKLHGDTTVISLLCFLLITKQLPRSPDVRPKSAELYTPRNRQTRPRPSQIRPFRSLSCSMAFWNFVPLIKQFLQITLARIPILSKSSRFITVLGGITPKRAVLRKLGGSIRYRAAEFTKSSLKYYCRKRHYRGYMRGQQMIRYQEILLPGQSYQISTFPSFLNRFQLLLAPF